MQQMKGIYVMNDIHMVTLITQCMRQTVDVHRIAPEAVRWVKSRQM
jgi:ribosomal protein L24E